MSSLWQISIFGSGGVDPTTIDPNSVLTLGMKGLSVALAIIGGIVVVYIVLGGIQYITAAGNAGEQTNAKKTITYALMGLVLVGLAFLLVGEVLQRLNFVGTV